MNKIKILKIIIMLIGLIIVITSASATHVPIQIIYEQNFSSNVLYPPSNNDIQDRSIFCGNSYEGEMELSNNELKYTGGDNNGGTYFSIHQNTTNSSFNVIGDYNVSWKLKNPTSATEIVGVCGTDTNLDCVHDDCNMIYYTSAGLMRIYTSALDGSTDFTDCGGQTYSGNATLRLERIGNVLYGYINDVQKCTHTISASKFNLTKFKYWTFAETGTNTDSIIDDMIFQFVGLTQVADIPPNVTWTDENPPNDFGTKNNGTLSYYYNCSDEDTANVNAHLFVDGVPHQSNYNIPQGTNQTLNVTLGDLSDGSHNINITCDDGELNESVLKTLFIDRIEPDIIFYIPSINGSNFDVVFDSNITIEDLNLWSTNLTVYNTSGSIQYNNYTEDWNISFLQIKDEIDIGAYVGGTYDICLEGCDAHTKNKLPDDFSYIVNGQRIDFQDVPIFINGNIKEIKLTETTDRVNIQVDLFQVEEFSITLDQCFKPVSNSEYYGHFVCKDKNLWFDTMPYLPTYIIKDQYNRYEIFISPQEKEISFESVGVLNCETQCINFDGDTNEPLVFLELPENNHITYNHSQQFDFNISHPPPAKVINCTIEIDGVQNQTLTGSPFLTTDTTQSITITNLFDISQNRTLTWAINCTDNANHIANNGEVRNLQFMTNVSVPPTTPTTTAQALLEIKDLGEMYLIFIIWLIVFACSLIFWKIGIFTVISTIYGIGIVVLYDFNGMIEFRILFFIINVATFVMLALGYFYDSGNGRR